MQGSSVRLSVPSFGSHTTVAGLLQWAGGQEISIDCCTASGSAANASSVTLSADVGS